MISHGGNFKGSFHCCLWPNICNIMDKQAAAINRDKMQKMATTPCLLAGKAMF